MYSWSDKSCESMLSWHGGLLKIPFNPFHEVAFKDRVAVASCSTFSNAVETY